MPLSRGYDFLGKQPRKSRIRAIQEEVVQEESSVVPDEPVKELEVTVEEVPAPEIEEEVVEEVFIPEEEESLKETKSSKPVVKVEPEGIPAQEEKSTFYEIEYDTLPVGNAMDKLPTSKSGNYVVVYRSDNCIYCDKLIEELKGNIGDYILVSVHCNGVVRDPFYTRLTYQYFPNFLVIKNKSVKYYGSGYRTLEDFKKLL